jgi:hypothetical protein
VGKPDEGTWENQQRIEAFRSRTKQAHASDPWLEYKERRFVVLYDEPECSKFLAAVQRIKRRRQRTHRLTRLARMRVKAALRKLRG